MQDLETYRGFLKSDRWDEWRELKTDQRKGIPPPPLQKPYPEDALLVDLVPARDLTVGTMPLIDAIRRRRSRRSFSGEPLTLEELSFLLWATQGIDTGATRGAREDDSVRSFTASAEARPAFALRTVPSGGARHPFETYIMVNRVRGLGTGLYRYLPLEHKLLFLAEDAGLREKVADAFSKWQVSGAVLFIWTAIPYRTEWRYSIVSPKLIAQDSGHLCQNLYLASEAIGAGTCAVGAYDQAKVDAVAGVDGEDEFTIYVAPVGKIEV
jgi:SagB-type dehydrogenase family enzyme